MATKADCSGAPGRDADVAIILDVSGSMKRDYYETNRIEASKKAVIEYLDTLNPSASVAFLTDPPSRMSNIVVTGVSDVKTTVSGLQATGSERMDTALEVMGTWLNSGSGSAKEILFITDGYVAEDDDPIDVAAGLKNAGTTIRVVTMMTIEQMSNPPIGPGYWQNHGFTQIARIHNAIASTGEHYSGYQKKISELFSNFAADGRDCEEKEPPESEELERPREEQCPPDDCGNWDVQKNDGDVSTCSVDGKTINIVLPEKLGEKPPVPKPRQDKPPERDINVKEPVPKPRQDKPPERDINVKEPEYKTICKNLVKNGDFEDTLNHWTVVKNDGFVDAPYNDDVNSVVLRYGYFAEEKDPLCSQVIRNHGFDDGDKFWSIQRDEGYARIDKITSCATGLILEMTQTTSHYRRCSLPNTPPVAYDFDVVLEKPCDLSDSDNFFNFDLVGSATDVDGDLLCLKSVDTPSKGTLVDYGDGTIRWEPPANGVMTSDEVVTFTYVISDRRGGLDTGTITITCPPNDPPFIKQDPYREVLTRSMTPLLFQLSTFADDPDFDPLFMQSYTTPSWGTLTPQPNGDMLYTPDVNMPRGTVTTFTYTMSDGMASATGTIEIENPANVAPVANPITTAIPASPTAFTSPFVIPVTNSPPSATVITTSISPLAPGSAILIKQLMLFAVVLKH